MVDKKKSTRSKRRITKNEVRPILWKRRQLVLLDQRKLPRREEYITYSGARDTARAIRTMVVRGAPAIGVTAALGMTMESRRFRPGRVEQDFEKAAQILADARPTAVNLFWALEVLRDTLAELGDDPDPSRVTRAFEQASVALMEQDVEINRAIGTHGAKLVGKKGGVVTHCNAGALATAGYGTAIGVIRSAWESGRDFEVYATETRPYLQGARLTSWELEKLGIPVHLMTDSMVGHLFQQDKIGAVVVGTDRTAANGDVANKIGTYQIAVLANRHGIPFYVAAPTSSIDLDCATGRDIPIEQRDKKEVTHVTGKRIAPEGIGVFNPAFDVTPAELVTGIITEHGVVKAGNYDRGLARAVAKSKRRPSKK